MALSDFTVRQAKVTGKDYTLSDFDGLSLAVSATGSKSWHFRYYWAASQKRMSLGTYPEVSLREAREARDQARTLLAKGINPRIDRKRKRQAVRLAAENSFHAVYLLWLAHRKLELKEGRQSTLSQIQRIFKKDVLPRLGEMSIFDVRRPDLLEVLAKIEARRAHTIAEKVRTWFSQMFRFALVKVHGLEQNPAADLDVVAVPKPPVANNPFLRLPELPEFLCKLRRYRGQLTTQLGIRFLLLTGVRTGELRYAEPSQFHLDRGLWIIPPEVVKQLQNDMQKNGKRPQDIPPYVVPLSAQAIEIARYLLEQVKPAQRHLLAHRSDLKKTISENTLNQAIGRMGYKGLLTGHGLRGTISTALNEIGYPKVWVDAQLSHADPNKVSATYNHALYVEPRRHMMQDWADRVDLLEQGQIEAAGMHLTVHIEGVPTVTSGDSALLPIVPESGGGTSPSWFKPSLVVDPNEGGPVFQRLSPLPPKPEPKLKDTSAISEIQHERQEMLSMYEAPDKLPVPVFAKLAGKSKDQINREIKAGRLLSLSMGNRGQRIPDWQLDPLKQRLVREVLQGAGRKQDAWRIYGALIAPCEEFGGRSPLDTVTPQTLTEAVRIVSRCLH